MRVRTFSSESCVILLSASSAEKIPPCTNVCTHVCGFQAYERRMCRHTNLGMGKITLNILHNVQNSLSIFTISRKLVRLGVCHTLQAAYV